MALVPIMPSILTRYAAIEARIVSETISSTKIEAHPGAMAYIPVLKALMRNSKAKRETRNTSGNSPAIKALVPPIEEDNKSLLKCLHNDRKV